MKKITIVRKPGTRRIALLLAIVIPLSIAVIALSITYVGVTSEVWTGGQPLSTEDLSLVPQAVTDDAIRLASELYGDYQESYEDFATQLLVMYLEVQDKDFVVFFNSGGWGWNLVEASPGWSSIFTGIQSELTSSGYKSLLLNYQRTAKSLTGRINEIAGMVTGYSSKSSNLAYQVDFLTKHNPDLNVIITGESNGTIISDSTMRILANNPKVYSIQTGTPFWHTSSVERTLVLNDNGIVPDSFHQGDFLAMVRANLNDWLGLSQAEEQLGTIFHSVKAPGHEYRWQQPGVCPQITDFLKQNFGTKW